MESTSHAPEVEMLFPVNAEVTVTTAQRTYAGTVTQVKGPKTREVRDASGCMHWNVKVSSMTPAGQ
jgi:hypothetical protein